MKISAKLYFTIIISLCIASAFGVAPPDSTGVKNVDGKNFIVYKVNAKEGWFGIAKKYNLSTPELQQANPKSGKDLKVGQEILIPIPVIVTKESVTKTTVVRDPVYYDVKKKETLYSISKKYNTVPDSLKKWNNISDKKVKSDERLIVGYMARVIEPPPPPPKKDTVVEKPKPVVKPKPKTTAPPKVKHPVDEQGIAAWIDDGADEKSTVYYALHRTAPPGTIIKVTNNMNKKYVFVKVLASLPDTGDNYDLIIKISKSTAEKLGVRDRRFQCELNYSVTE
jgi:LysM repeat protein